MCRHYCDRWREIRGRSRWKRKSNWGRHPRQLVRRHIQRHFQVKPEAWPSPLHVKWRQSLHLRDEGGKARWKADVLHVSPPITVNREYWTEQTATFETEFSLKEISKSWITSRKLQRKHTLNYGHLILFQTQDLENSLTSSGAASNDKKIWN